MAAGNVGKTVHFGVNAPPSGGYGDLLALFDRMGSGQLQVVLVHDANPLYAAPQAGTFAAQFAKVPFKVSTAPILDETAAACDLILPNLHALERWDDQRSRVGVAGVMQPTVEPVFEGMHTGDVLLKVAKAAGGAAAKFTAPSFEAHLKGVWRDEILKVGPADFDAAWRDAVGQGGVFHPAPAPVVPALAAGALTVNATDRIRWRR